MKIISFIMPFFLGAYLEYIGFGLDTWPFWIIITYATLYGAVEKRIGMAEHEL